MSMDDIFADKILDFQIRGTFICGPWWIWLSILTFSRQIAVLISRYSCPVTSDAFMKLFLKNQANARG